MLVLRLDGFMTTAWLASLPGPLPPTRARYGSCNGARASIPCGRCRSGLGARALFLPDGGTRPEVGRGLEAEGALHA